MTVGEVIHEYRKKNKISLGAFARKSGLSKSYLFALENDSNPTTGKPIKPTLETALACCKAMEMDIVTFIKKVSPDDADSLIPHIKAPMATQPTTKKEPANELPIPPTLYMPTTVPNHIPVNNSSVVEAYEDRRILILRSRIPRKGEFVYIPIREYMMPVGFTVLDAGGGMFLAHAEACGTCLFSIFDLDRTVFSKYGGARAIVDKWKAEEQLNLAP